jgi:hypothetical protein
MTTSHTIILNEGFGSPESKFLTERLEQVSVTSGLEAPSTFKATFGTDICDDSDGGIDLFDHLRYLRPGTMTHVSFVVIHDDKPHCLIKGMVTGFQTTLEDGGAGSKVLIEGEDRSLLLEREAAAYDTEGLLSEAVDPSLILGFDDLPDTRPTAHAHQFAPLRSQPGESDRAFIQSRGAHEGRYLWVEATVERSADALVVRDKGFFAGIGKTGGSTPPAPALLTLPDRVVFRINREAACAHEPLDTRFVVRVPRLQAQIGDRPPTEAVVFAEVDDLSNEITARQVDLRDVIDRLPFDPADPSVTDAQIENARSTTVGREGIALEERILELRTSQYESALSDSMWNITVTLETHGDALPLLIRPHHIVKVEGAGRMLDAQSYVVRQVVHTVDKTGHRMSITLMGSEARADA